MGVAGYPLSPTHTLVMITLDHLGARGYPEGSSGTQKTRTRSGVTLPKTNMDTQNDGLEKVTPFKTGNFWYLS